MYLAEVESARKDLVSFLVREKVASAEPLVRTAILASLIRFERFEWMLEKATELGVARVVPVEAERSERGLEQAAAKRIPRWNRIVREASEQSRRARLPEIGTPVALLTRSMTCSDWRAENRRRLSLRAGRSESAAHTSRFARRIAGPATQ